MTRRALLDVNVLIALHDPQHVSHGAALAWLGANVAGGWASCPLTQNGCIRIMSQPSYPNACPPPDFIARLRKATQTSHHEFWADDLSLTDGAYCEAKYVHGARQITDVYLLALAVRHEGRFVTFDARVPLSAVPRATSAHLVVV